MEIKLHTLASGATVCVTSPGHGFRFSDGTQSGPQDIKVCAQLTCARQTSPKGEVKGMAINETRMELSDVQLEFLEELCARADIVLVPFPVLSALRAPPR